MPGLTRRVVAKTAGRQSRGGKPAQAQTVPAVEITSGHPITLVLWKKDLRAGGTHGKFIITGGNFPTKTVSTDSYGILNRNQVSGNEAFIGMAFEKAPVPSGVLTTSSSKTVA